MPNFLRGTGNTQITYTSGPIGVPSPVTITFNSLQDSSGSAINFNTGNSRFTFQQNKSYRLIASVNAINTAGPNIQYQWVDLTNASPIGSVGYTQRNTAGSLGLAEAIFTPTVTTIVELQARPTPNANTFVNIFSIGDKWFDIQAIEDGTTPSGNISVSNISVSNSVTAGGTVTAGNLAVGSGFVSAGNINSAGPISAALTMSAAGNVVGANILTAGFISATGNIRGNYLQGNGSQLTGVSASLNGNLAGNLLANGFQILNQTIISASGNVTAGNLRTIGSVTATGNITGNYFIGNGSLLTGIAPGNYSNTNVAAYLTTYSGNIQALNISAIGNVVGSNFSTIGQISATGTITTPNNVSAGNLVTAGAVVAANIRTTNGVFFANNTPYSYNGPLSFVYQSSPQAIPFGNNQWLVYWNAKSDDVNNSFNVAQSKFQPTVAGYYQINASLGMTFTSAPAPGITNNALGIVAWKNGVGIFASPLAFPYFGNGIVALNFMVYLNGSSDYLQIYGISNIVSGTWVTAIGGANGFQACWLRRP